MKSKLLLILVLQLILWSCKSSSVLKEELLTENKILKERLAQLEEVDTSKLNAVVELSNMNVVYRGVQNPIRISIPNAMKIEAIGKGLKKIDDFGNYTMVPTSGNHVDINVLGIMPNNDTITDIKRLRIKNIGKFIGRINGIGCGNKCEVFLTKEQLEKGEIDAKLYDFLFDWAKAEITSFKIKFQGRQTIKIEGNKIVGLESKIQSLKAGDRVQIFDIKLRISARALIKPPSPILIRIIED